MIDDDVGDEVGVFKEGTDRSSSGVVLEEDFEEDFELILNEAVSGSEIWPPFVSTVTGNE